MTRRSYGTGSLWERADSAGRESWYGSWWVGDRRVKRRLGVKRSVGSAEGLTRAEAERELRRQMALVKPSTAVGERLEVVEVARRYVLDAQRRGRKPSTCANIESEVRTHLAPFFRGKAIDTITDRDVEDLLATLEAKQLAPKTVRNVIATLSALFNFARAPKRRWAEHNPCAGIELPVARVAHEPRFLTLEEVDAMVAHVPAGMFQAIDRALLLTAALTGMRKGELAALRWRDVDWPARRIRVRRNYTRGEFGTPKSALSFRAVPMADEVAGTLDRLCKQSRWQGDDDLVFAHPISGEVLAKSNISRRMRVALRDAGLDESHRFHDLRHTFATRLAAQGVPMRSLQEMMGHADYKTTLIYAAYAPAAHEAELIDRAFARGAPGSAPGASRGSVRGTDLSESEVISPDLTSVTAGSQA